LSQLSQLLPCVIFFYLEPFLWTYHSHWLLRTQCSAYCITMFARSSQLVEFPAVPQYSMFIDVHPFTGFSKCSVCAALQYEPAELGFDYGRRNFCACTGYRSSPITVVFPRNARHDGLVPGASKFTTGSDGSEMTES
jgi:hypothetical protein